MNKVRKYLSKPNRLSDGKEARGGVWEMNIDQAMSVAFGKAKLP
jgi:hypothetical protein